MPRFTTELTVLQRIKQLRGKNKKKGRLETYYPKDIHAFELLIDGVCGREREQGILKGLIVKKAEVRYIEQDREEKLGVCGELQIQQGQSNYQLYNVDHAPKEL